MLLPSIGPVFSPPEGAETGAVCVRGPGHEEAVGVSPIEELRRELGLSISQFAAALGIGYNQLHQTERGRQNIPRKAWPALREIGVDVDRLRSRQEEWFEERARKLREELAEKIAGAGGRAAA